jgi:hypothetical protein
MHCPQCEAVIPNNVDTCFACGGAVRGWMTAGGPRVKGGGKRVGSAQSSGPHVSFFSSKWVAAVGARLIMGAISLAFLAGIGLAMGGKNIRSLKDLKSVDFAHQAQAAYQNVANALTGR